MLLRVGLKIAKLSEALRVLYISFAIEEAVIKIRHWTFIIFFIRHNKMYVLD